MQVVSSYGAEIKNKNIPIRHTLALYREAVCCLTEIRNKLGRPVRTGEVNLAKVRFSAGKHNKPPRNFYNAQNAKDNPHHCGSTSGISSTAR